jgi:tubulin monoglycylase TTLL3/8
LVATITEVLQSMCLLIGEAQFGLTGSQNAWILKPGGKSRGRGIEVHADMNDLLKAILLSRDTIWVVQKYIERPLIIL